MSLTLFPEMEMDIYPVKFLKILIPYAAKYEAAFCETASKLHRRKKPYIRTFIYPFVISFV